MTPSALAHFIVNRPALVIAVVLLMTAMLGAGLHRGLQLDVSATAFIEKDSQQRHDYEAARSSFGDDQYLIIAAVSEDAFAPANIARLRALHQQIERTPDVVEVLSLVNLPYARSVNGGASLEKLVPENASAERLNEARRVAASDRLYVHHFVSADARTASLTLLLDPKLTTDERHEIVSKLYDLARQSGFAQVYFAGDPFSQWRGTDAIKRDLKLFLPLTLLFIAALLWLCFRSWKAVVFTLLSIAIGLVWLMGLMAWMNAHITVIGLMLPTLMLAIGCSYMIHVLNQIGIESQRSVVSGQWSVASVAEAGEADRKVNNGQRTTDNGLERALRFISIPVAVSALTIIAGFLSLTFTAIPAVRETAIYAAIGAAFTMLLALTFLPATLALFDGRGAGIRVGLQGRMVRALMNTGEWATSRQGLLYFITGLIVVFSIVGVTRIVIDIDYFRFFKPGAETSVGLDEVSQRLAGVVSFDVVIESDKSGAIESPETLKKIAQLQTFAELGLAGSNHTLSLVDYLRHLNRAFHDNDQQFYTIPDQNDVIAELLSERKAFARFLTEDGRRTRILVRSTLTSSSQMSEAVRALEAKARELFPDQRTFATGTMILLNRTSDFIGADQRNSITLALVTIFIVLALLFRSWRMGFTALFPNMIPVLFFFGFMGWRGIPLNLTTSLVASVVLGLAVDNAVQFIVRFRRVLPGCASVRAAIIESMRLSGRPIIYANIALASAFAIFAFSTFIPIESFGLLSAVTILGCLIEDLVLLPARMTAPIFHEKR